MDPHRLLVSLFVRLYYAELLDRFDCIQFVVKGLNGPMLVFDVLGSLLNFLASNAIKPRSLLDSSVILNTSSLQQRRRLAEKTGQQKCVNNKNNNN